MSKQWLWRRNEWLNWKLISDDEARRLAAEDDDSMYEFIPYTPTKPELIGVPLPACLECAGKGVVPEDGIDYVCGSCWGTGVRMDLNGPYVRQSGWKLHRCPDGKQCRTDYPGGCASGWCAHFEVSAENLHTNIV